MSAAREKDSADFDLEAFIDLFDEALTSDDPSVQKTLQHLMVICALARNHDKHDRRSGPLRRLYNDQYEILRRLERLESGSTTFGSGGYNPAPMPSYPTGPTIWPQSIPKITPISTPNTGTWPGYPNTTWCSSGTSDADIDLLNLPTFSDSTTPISAATNIAERVDDLLKSEKYKGSGVSTVNTKVK